MNIRDELGKGKKKEEEKKQPISFRCFQANRNTIRKLVSNVFWQMSQENIKLIIEVRFYLRLRKSSLANPRTQQISFG